MFFRITLSAIGWSLAFFTGAFFSFRLHKAHLRVRKPFTWYLFLASLNWCGVTGLAGLTPLFFPENFELWKITDSIVHIFVALVLAYLYRFFLSITIFKSAHKSAELVFWVVLLLGLGITLFDFLNARAPFIAYPGVIVWNNHPVVGMGITFSTLIVICLLVVFFFTQRPVKSLLIELRFLLFAAFFGFLGFGGMLVTIFTNPLLVLIGDILVIFGSLAMLLITLLRFFE